MQLNPSLYVSPKVAPFPFIYFGGLVNLALNALNALFHSYISLKSIFKCPCTHASVSLSFPRNELFYFVLFLTVPSFDEKVSFFEKIFAR
jgi:hypothetical protein